MVNPWNRAHQSPFFNSSTHKTFVSATLYLSMRVCLCVFWLNSHKFRPKMREGQKITVFTECSSAGFGVLFHDLTFLLIRNDLLDLLIHLWYIYMSSKLCVCVLRFSAWPQCVRHAIYRSGECVFVQYLVLVALPLYIYLFDFCAHFPLKISRFSGEKKKKKRAAIPRENQGKRNHQEEHVISTFVSGERWKKTHMALFDDQRDLPKCDERVEIDPNQTK